MKNNVHVKSALEGSVSTLPFVSLDKDNVSGLYLRFPFREELGEGIQENLIIRLYNR
jgi:ribosomal protein S4